MSLKVRPDPQEPAGGYGFLELPAGALPDGPVKVAIFDVFSERWLAASEADAERVEIGNPNWQSERFEFGPFEVDRKDGSDRVRIGPEIVNKIDEYMPLRISVGTVTEDLAWPDDVPPRAGAAVLGGLQVIARKSQTDAGAVLVGRETQASAEAEPADPVHVPTEENPEPDPPEPQSRGLGKWLLLVLLLALVIAGAAWFFLRDSTQDAATDPDTAVGSETVTDTDAGADTDAVADTCTYDALAALGGGFGATVQAIRGCGSDTSAETALRLIERGADANDPDALLLLGTLYDAGQTDPQIETVIGLTFADDPAQAAEYYAKAGIAGSGEARTRLPLVCDILRETNSTLAKGAYDDYCS